MSDQQDRSSSSEPLKEGIQAIDAALKPKTKGWRQQYGRMKRAHVRAKAARRIDDQTVDDYYHFFVWCYHLKDWLKNDEALPQAVRNAVEEFVKQRRGLEIAGDIVNGAKHLHRDEGRARIDPDAKVSAIPSAFQRSAFQGNAFQTGRVVVVVDGNYEDAAEMADGCVAAWDDFLRTHGLEADG